SPGKILSIKIPTFEALSQFGTATITTKNIGELEASYSLTFHCPSGVSYMAKISSHVQLYLRVLILVYLIKQNASLLPQLLFSKMDHRCS
ncbi:hypothetical protein BHE74_00018769, partial [Ensete ventricosum]